MLCYVRQDLAYATFDHQLACWTLNSAYLNNLVLLLIPQEI